MDGIIAALIGVAGAILLQTIAGIFVLGRVAQKADYAAQEARDAKGLLVRHLEAHAQEHEP